MVVARMAVTRVDSDESGDGGDDVVTTAEREVTMMRLEQGI